MKAYVLIQIQPGAQAPNGSLLAIPEIVEAEQLSGPYDAIALAVTNGDRPIDAVVEDVRLLPGVLRAIAAPLRRPAGEGHVLATPVGASAPGMKAPETEATGTEAA